MDPLRITTDMTEPDEGTVVVMSGMTGTAFQRHFSDGLWHGRPGAFTWADLLSRYHVGEAHRTESYVVFVP